MGGISRDSRHKRRLTGGRMPIHKNKIINCVYNATSNEMVRTNTLAKNAIVTLDATPFTSYVNGHYRGLYGEKAQGVKVDWAWEKKEDHKDFKFDKDSKDRKAKYLHRRLNNTVESRLQEQLNRGVLYGCISSRPGQSGRVDGYLLEGKELDFYLKKMPKKKL